MTRPELTATESGLASFMGPVRDWFVETFDRPTPPQSQGWPAIQRSEHTLILAPTGSGKTLAAFLWGIDQLYREQLGATDKIEPGVRLVYISPLKALNNDIHRNLRLPLAGIRKMAEKSGTDLPPIQVAVRSGDTPSRERQAMVRKPPQILITTPESFYLLLTSPKARDMFRTVRTVIVDEIHTLAGNKRGVHLSLSLERLEHLAEQPVQRLGLSATIQPLDEVARYLGGNAWSGEGETRSLQPRLVTVVDAGYQKGLDVRVVSVVEDFSQLPGDSIWPSIIPRVLSLIRAHRTTLIFANNRRLAERTADRLNEQIAAEAAGKELGLIEGGVVKGVGMMGAGTGAHGSPIRVHHGSVSKEARLDLERKLKAGELPALVGTSSLELGIDIGTVDLIVQLQSPHSVAQGLQRVGRSGHIVGQTSKGRFFPTHREDVVESAAIAGGMLRGEVEPTHTPRQPLDVLAQQIVAMVSVETWGVDDLYDLVRCACAYEGLTWRVYQITLEMLAGRYPSQAYRELRARLSWDRVNQKLAALPGSRLLALTNGGTIPNTGAFGAYLGDGKTKLGELDEEFVFETRIGDTFQLGSQVWRVIELTDDRVLVAEAPGAVPRMPFWRGEYPWRPYELGVRVGAFRRLVAERLEQVRQDLDLQHYAQIRDHRQTQAVQDLLDWLGEEYALDALSAWHTVDYLVGQLEHAGALSSDRTILVEVFEDAIGDPRLVIHSPFGGRVNGPWELALVSALRERAGIEVEAEVNDDGILLRLLDMEAEFPLDMVTDIGPAEARERILRELPNSAVFGARFRQNAARALLLPGVRGGKRTPFWLQRLRARDLLQIVRQFDDFPIVAETYRDCLQDVMDLPHLEQVLTDIQRGEIEVVVVESFSPSPVAQSLLWHFVNTHMYEWDDPKAESQIRRLAVNRDLLQDLLQDVALDELFRPEAIETVRGQLQHTASNARARSVEELAVLLQQVGDLSADEVAQRTTRDPEEWLARLQGEGRIVELVLPTAQGDERRWIPTEYVPEYRAAFGLEHDGNPLLSPDEARSVVLRRFLDHAGPITAADIVARYAFPEPWLQAELKRLVEVRELAHGRFTPQLAQGQTAPVISPEYVDRHTLERIHRQTLHVLRQEVQPVPFAAYSAFLARWQHLHPEERLVGEGALTQVLQQLRAVPVVGSIWEQDVLPLRLADYQPQELEALCQEGEVVWVGSGGVDPRRGRFRFLFRGEGSTYLEPVPEDMSELSEAAQAIYAFLKSEGALFMGDICAALELQSTAAETALSELALAGLVTNDSLSAMRKMTGQGPSRTGPQKPYSSLEAQLAQRLGHSGTRSDARSGTRSDARSGTRSDARSGARSGVRSGRGIGKPGPAQYRAAKRRVHHRLAQVAPVQVQSQGRWTLVHRFGVLGKAVDLEERARRQARQLLARYGVVTYECLEQEYGSWTWQLIYRQLQRLEMRGEIRRGYFVQGRSGVQFALADVVDRLREIRDSTADGEVLVVLNACDPANLYGPARDDGPLTEQGEPLAFARLPSTWLVQHRGWPVLVASGGGAHLTTVQGADEGVIRRALQGFLDHRGSSVHSISVETWNGDPVLGGAGQPLLEAVGFYRSYPQMVWERRP